MTDHLFKNARQAFQNARGSLTNGSTCYSFLMVAENNKANRAECCCTPHGSNPTLSTPVTGLHGIIQDRGTSVLRGFCGPTDSTVGLGRFAVLGMGEV
jgi:hypothetical protein